MKLSEWAKQLKRESLALYLAARDPRTPFYAKILAGVIVAYAFSPIDLVPDFIPILGYLDDVILLPLGIWFVLKLIPKDVMAESREKAKALSEKPISRTAAVIIVLLWIVSIALFAFWLYTFLIANPL
jgi:uncharacterized membrane protein YkvA (DUF1232 family)